MACISGNAAGVHKSFSKALQKVTETLAGRSRQLPPPIRLEFHCHTGLSHYVHSYERWSEKVRWNFYLSFLVQGQEVNLDEEELSHAEVSKQTTIIIKKNAVKTKIASITAAMWPFINTLVFDQLSFISNILFFIPHKSQYD